MRIDAHVRSEVEEEASESTNRMLMYEKSAAHPHVKSGGPKASAVQRLQHGCCMGAAKVGKGVRRMPRLWKARKDAASCDKPW